MNSSSFKLLLYILKLNLKRINSFACERSIELYVKTGNSFCLVAIFANFQKGLILRVFFEPFFE